MISYPNPKITKYCITYNTFLGVIYLYYINFIKNLIYPDTCLCALKNKLVLRYSGFQLAENIIQLRFRLK